VVLAFAEPPAAAPIRPFRSASSTRRLELTVERVAELSSVASSRASSRRGHSPMTRFRAGSVASVDVSVVRDSLTASLTTIPPHILSYYMNGSLLVRPARLNHTHIPLKGLGGRRA
jgi:hypothetical protein